MLATSSRSTRSRFILEAERWIASALFFSAPGSCVGGAFRRSCAIIPIVRRFANLAARRPRSRGRRTRRLRVEHLVHEVAG
jgi:hypothetical protein